MAQLRAQRGDFMIPVYVINLRDSVERREHMKRQLSQLNIPFTFIEAISGKEIDEAVPGISKNEPACALSHLHAARLVAKSGAPFGAVFEDDIIVRDECRQFLEEAALRAVPRFDVLQLFTTTKRSLLSARIASFGEHKIIARALPFMGMQGLIYSAAGAHRIHHEVNISSQIDQMLFNEMAVFGLRTASISPAVVIHGDFGSTIRANNRPRVTNKPLREMIRGARCVWRGVNFAAAWITS